MADRADDQGRAGMERPRAGDAIEVEETTVIRAEIVEVRERMSDTLDEIGERLNPHVVKEQVTERVKEGIHAATIGRVEHMARDTMDRVKETRSSMADTIRDNPIPAAMVAVGLGWLMWNGRKDDGDDRQYRASMGAGAGRPYETGMAYDAYGRPLYGGVAYGGQAEGRDASGGVMDQARDRASHLGESVKDRAGSLAHGAQSAGGSIVDGAQHAAGAVAHGAQDLAGSVARRTRRGAGRLEDKFHDNPLAIGAVSVALGIAAGLSAPTTDREVQLMGGARDRLVDRVKDTVHETADKASDVADRVMDETKTAAREEGLTPSR